MNKRLSDDDVAQHWDDNADAWAEGIRKGQNFFNSVFNTPEFLQFIGDLNNKVVLDAGCGEGSFSRKLAELGAAVNGIDLSPRMLEIAREEEKHTPRGIDYRQGSFSDLSMFDDDKFDVVVSAMALMDASDFDLTSKEFFRVLQPGGAFYFNVRHPCFSTPDMKIVGTKEDPRQAQIIANYFAEEPHIDRWSFTGRQDVESKKTFAVPRFPRRVSDYINGLTKAGFVVRRIAEPRPSAALCQQYPTLSFWREHVAMFLYVHAEKTPRSNF